MHSSKHNGLQVQQRTQVHTTAQIISINSPPISPSSRLDVKDTPRKAVTRLELLQTMGRPNPREGSGRRGGVAAPRPASSPEHKDAFVCFPFSLPLPRGGEAGDGRNLGFSNVFLSQTQRERRRKDFPHPARLE